MPTPDDWLQQLARHFRPFATRTPADMQITAGRFNHAMNYAVMIRISGAATVDDPDAIQETLAQEVIEAAAMTCGEETYLHGAYDTGSSPLASLGVGLAAAAGVYLFTGGNLIASGITLALAFGVHHIFNLYANEQRLDRHVRQAGEIIRQFRPYGPRPETHQDFYFDAATGAAVLYRRFGESKPAAETEDIRV